MKIGVFDSGIGGTTVFKEILKQDINAQFYYFADNKNTPYGIKNKEEVKNYIIKNIEYLVNVGCEIIVIACNTATILCIENLRKKLPNICFIGIEPAIKKAIENDNKKKILVTATTITLKEEKINNLIKNLEITDKVELLPLDRLVIYAEKNSSKIEVKKYLKEKLNKYKFNEYGQIVLGCTHFPIFKEEFKEILPNIKIVDGSKEVVKNLKNKINDMNLKKTNTCTTLILTKEDSEFIDNFNRLLNINIDTALYI